MADTTIERKDHRRNYLRRFQDKIKQLLVRSAEEPAAGNNSLNETEQPIEKDREILTKINLLTDLAIGEVKDGRKDGLGFETYAQVLGEAAVGTPGPFVIGIFGEWGTGKTSLMRMIDEYLLKNHDSTTVRVWFNAWRFEREDHPIVPLVATIIQEIQNNKSNLKKLGDVGQSLLRSLRAMAYGFSGKTKFAVPGFAELEASFVAKDAIDRGRQLDQDPLLDKSLYFDAFETLSKVELGKDVRLVIIIDDLDRCLPDMAIKLLESIKLVFSQRGFIFIFGAATTVIDSYLQHQYKEKFGIDNFVSRSYLDKIIQLPFYIPPHSERIGGFSESILSNLKDPDYSSLKKILPIICTVSASNPRTTIRFINNLIIDQAISRLLMKKGEEIPVGFFAITRSLQQRWPLMFDILIKYPDHRNWITGSDKDEIGQSEIPSDTIRGGLHHMIKTDADFRELLFSEVGIKWLADDKLRKAAIEFIFTERSEIDGTQSETTSPVLSDPIKIATGSTRSSRTKKTVYISSTALDLAEHRSEARNACLERDLFPIMIEHFPADDNDAVRASTNAVDKADIYLAIVGHRYGYIPEGQKISIQEIEYNRALEMGIPRLIFLINENEPVEPSKVDKGRKAAKLENFKKRLSTENIIGLFKSPEDLHTRIANALFSLTKPLEITNAMRSENTDRDSDIPAPPEAYVAHPYTLLQTPDLIGRQKELELMTDWVSDPDTDVYKQHILSIVAIGGLGKSVLTWRWFNEIAPKKMNPLAGHMWWSFYDPNADFENFVLHALAYVSNNPVEDIRDKMPPPERETRLLAVLNQTPFLLVLDGFERMLNAYSSSASSLAEDTDVNSYANARRTADPRVGQFLKKLAQVKESRVLISTRLQPAELENEVEDPLPGVYKYDLKSLPDADAIEFWRRLGVEGDRDRLLHLFRQFDKHTLLIQVLAGEVRRFRPAPGDLEKWLAANPKFDPASYSNTKDRTIHVLEFPLSSLSKEEQDVLSTIVAFRNPPSYATLAAILIGEGKPCADNDKLGEVLTDLENCGLLGWNRQTDRYEIHPIVRSVVWNRLDEDARKGIYAILQAYFETLPMAEFDDIYRLEDLTPAIELYYALIGMERYEEALVVFRDRLNDVTLYRLSANRQRLDMLEMLFPDGLDKPPRLSQQDAQSYTLNSLALAYQLNGQPGWAVPLVRRANEIVSEVGDDSNLAVGLKNLAYVLQVTGSLWKSEIAARGTLKIARRLEDRFDEAVGLYLFGQALAMRGDSEKSVSILRRSLNVLTGQNEGQMEGVIYMYLAQRAIWFKEYEEAITWADRAWELAQVNSLERDLIRAARVQGEAALKLGDLEIAEERLHYALARTRAVNNVEEEVQVLVTLTELRRRQGDEKAAREFLDDVWEFAERGPYPLFHADALNVLAEIERDAGNADKAIEAATKAYQLAWCDGPPYAYHWGLVKARKHLEELGAPLPEMPPFDESKFEPMPEVEIDPDDEFHDSSPS